VTYVVAALSWHYVEGPLQSGKKVLKYLEDRYLSSKGKKIPVVKQSVPE